MGDSHAVYVKIEGEPFLSRARQYRADLEAAMKEWAAFAEKIGADEIGGCFPGGSPRSLIFNSGKVPDGWVKPNRQGRSWPKKKCPNTAELDALPVAPSESAVFGDALIHSLSYEGAHRSGAGRIGRPFGPRVGWTGDIFVGCIPHAGKAARAHLAAYPADTITTKGAVEWTVPEGLVEMTDAEYELLLAQEKVRQEREPSPA